MGNNPLSCMLSGVPDNPHYVVGSDGTIISTFSGNIKPLKSPIGSSGYKVLNIIKNGKRKTERVHRIVASAFIPNPENKYTVNHKDGDKTNNDFRNLEWATLEENALHAIENDLGGSSRKPVFETDKEGIIINEYESLSEASKETGLFHQNISAACHGITKSASGRFFTFSKELKWQRK